MNRNIVLVFLLLIAAVSTAQKQITVEDIYGRGVFRQASVRGINWMNDGRYYSAQQGNDIVKYDVTTGQIVETILKGSDLNPAISFVNYSFSADEKKLLLMTSRESIYRRSYKAEFYVYDLGAKSLSKLSNNGKQSYATFSPDGSKVAFARDNNLFYVTLSNMKEVAVTEDGVFNKIINGSTDWVTEEELSFTKAFEWSGDGNTILYLTFNESGVREYNLQKWNNGQLYPEDYKFKYPKAGEDNAKIKATIFDLSTSGKTPVDLDISEEFYLARVRTTKSPSTFSLVKLNRLQNQMDIVHVDAKTGKSSVILTEKND
ncbi:MAG: DPP IV N-terminal domain-containing protein, partial [Bacteroidota bacterium]